MTAEIAILNKSAVALAADSAVTISAGSDQQKIFDSEDKFFELTYENPIGVMINNTMHFMEAPLPVLIKRYRETAPNFQTVEEAANDFLCHLNDFAQSSPKRIEDEAVNQLARLAFGLISRRSTEELDSKIFDEDRKIKSELLEDIEDFKRKTQIWADEAREKQILVFERLIRRLQDAQFIGEEMPVLSDEQKAQVAVVADEKLPGASEAQRERSVGLIEQAMRKIGLGEEQTGLVVAGFGSDELFPTLISFELEGSFGGRLKYRQTDLVDIDRDGEKARVLPFAQREMVERFLYGLDNSIERQIAGECNSSVGLISGHILDALEMPEEDLQNLRDSVQDAEDEFSSGLTRTFEAIRVQSREEIEDMVEFMPKPEMARMAEALVNLTSIKRRVSRGFETVGGPIDVAVISRSEGFVWVSRKHYFPRELNERYVGRIRARP